MEYAFLAVRSIVLPLPLAIGRARHLRRLQHPPVDQPTCTSANGKGAALVVSLPEVGSVDDKSIREDERQRIARDIHDELGQQILVLRMDVVKLCAGIAETQPQLRAVADIVLQQLEMTMHSLRGVIRGLRPAELDLGLRAAFEVQCAQLNQRFGIACELAWNGGEIALSDRCATALFRTLQESLTNVQRHARASRVCIAVDSNDNRIIMSISDNGIGSVPADQAKTDAFGLLGIRERISALGGTLSIASAEHEGLTLTVSLPI